MVEPANLPWTAPIAEYERQAQALHDAMQSGDHEAGWRYKWVHPRFRGKVLSDVLAAIPTLGLDDARLVIAQDYHLSTWNDLETFARKAASDPEVQRFETAVEAVIAGDIDLLTRLLREHPDLVRARSSRRHRATLLHYIAANGVENVRQKTPDNAVAIATLLLDSGAEADALAGMYDQLCTTMSMLVTSAHPAGKGLQAPLAELLLDRGAELEGPGSEWQSALMSALTFGYLDTARAMQRRGATLYLNSAAGLGLVEEVTRLLPGSSAEVRHSALALAAQHGQTDVVRILLDAGEDPSRYNPEGHHSHSTPLHQAVWAGHLDLVRLLVERGARLDLRDTVYEGTPLGWAEFGKKQQIAEYLKSVGGKR
ncbi:MAG TPA: ankyrin repeat domain-containing protein [Gemmatimonadales bacterium]|nr:ankyrin repeat domain-containing protein [Gemmatimonadales bacterium]